MCKYCEPIANPNNLPDKSSIESILEDEDMIVQILPETPILRKKGGKRVLQIYNFKTNRLLELPILSYCPVCGRKLEIPINEDFIHAKEKIYEQYSPKEKEIIEIIKKYHAMSNFREKKMDLLREIQCIMAPCNILQIKAIYNHLVEKEKL